MRPFINIINEAQSRARFRLHPALDPNNYIMTDSLRDPSKWKARTYVGNNSNTGETGGLAEVGYIMISISDDTIIPISRDDEHHTGYDLLWDFAQGSYNSEAKKTNKPLPIDPNDYIPIWSYGQNYVYDESNRINLAIVLRKFLSYGGVDGILKGANDLRGRMVHLSDFANTDGKAMLFRKTDGARDTLAPVGQRIYDQFKRLSELLAPLDNTSDRIAAKPAFIAAASFFKNIPLTLGWGLGLEVDYLKAIPSQLRQLQKENDVQGLLELIFGFDGVKNRMHQNMKKGMKSDYHRDDIVGIWGNVDLAIDLLGRL